MGFLHGEKVGKLQSFLEYKSEDKSIFKPIILGKVGHTTVHRGPIVGVLSQGAIIYICLREWDLNSVRDIKVYVNWMGWGIHLGTQSQCH